MDLSRRVAFGNVLFNQAEVRSGLAGAFAELWLTSILVRERTFRSHARTMVERSSGQRRVPLQRADALRGACPVAQFK